MVCVRTLKTTLANTTVEETNDKSNNIIPTRLLLQARASRRGKKFFRAHITFAIFIPPCYKIRFRADGLSLCVPLLPSVRGQPLMNQKSISVCQHEINLGFILAFKSHCSFRFFFLNNNLHFPAFFIRNTFFIRNIL